MEQYRGEENEVSLKDYILKARDYFSEVIHYWYIPAVCILFVTAYQLYKYSKYIPVYPATITFSVDEDEAGSQGALSGMLSQFGLGSVRPARYNFDKILELGRSRRVVQSTLFVKTTIDGKEDFVANHLIRIYEFKIPAEDPNEKEMFLFTHDSIAAFSMQENEVLISLYHFIIGPPDDPSQALLTGDYNEDTNIMSLTAATKNETLSLVLSDRMFKSLSDYYINKAIEKSLKTYKIMTHKRDSILGELRSSEYQLANFDDRNRGLMMRTDAIGRLRHQRDVTALTVMYGEVLKNVEVADFSLRSKTPFIQVIDSPIPPIAPTQLSLLRKILIGFILGGLIGALIVVARKFFREMMAEKT